LAKQEQIVDTIGKAKELYSLKADDDIKNTTTSKDLFVTLC
jgi:hypothetical protein